MHGNAEVADLHNSNNRRGDVVRRSKKQLTVEAPRAVRRQKRAGNETPSDLGPEATRGISAALNTLLADMFALHMKTKNFHWHMSGPHFRDFHLLLDEQADNIFTATDVIAERVRKIGKPTLRSIGDISRRQGLRESDAENLTPFQMLAELRDDNLQLAANLRETHSVCEEQGDVASASFLETWIDEAEQRVWYLFEACRQAGAPLS